MKEQNQFTLADLKRLKDIMDREVDLDLQALVDLGFSWKEACANLKELRYDKALLTKIVKAILRPQK